MGFEQNKLIAFATLAGSDYAGDGVPRLGGITARKILDCFSESESLDVLRGWLQGKPSTYSCPSTNDGIIPNFSNLSETELKQLAIEVDNFLQSARLCVVTFCCLPGQNGLKWVGKGKIVEILKSILSRQNVLEQTAPRPKLSKKTEIFLDKWRKKFCEHYASVAALRSRQIPYGALNMFDEIVAAYKFPNISKEPLNNLKSQMQGRGRDVWPCVQVPFFLYYHAATTASCIL